MSTGLFQSIASALQKLFGDPETSAAQSRELEQAEVAAATLLAEMVRADLDAKEVDRRAAIDALRDLFPISEQKAEDLIDHVSHFDRRPTSYHPFVKVLNRSFSPEQKQRLVEHMWRVAHADDDVHKYEDHLVRKIAELLYVPHSQFIATKHRAKNHPR
ncbi:MAG: TerB family tellurite resistance protein [Burkholderiales bacterium]